MSCAAFIVVILVFTWYGIIEYYSAQALNSRLQSVNKIRSNALSESLVNSETCRTKQEKDQALQIIRQRIAESKQRVATMEETITLTKNRSQKNALNDAIEKEMIAQEVMQGHLERVYDKLINYP